MVQGIFRSGQWPPRRKKSLDVVFVSSLCLFCNRVCLLARLQEKLSEWIGNSTGMMPLNIESNWAKVKIAGS